MIRRNSLKCLPHANRPPALPVVLLNSWPPFPRSSGSAWMTSVRPKTLKIINLNNANHVIITFYLKFPDNEICLSEMSTFATPPAAVTFPKSPTCLSPSVGPPWVFPNGLKCAPADIQPLVPSPNSWTWNPMRKKEENVKFWSLTLNCTFYHVIRPSSH